MEERTCSTIRSHFLARPVGRNKSALDGGGQPDDYQRQGAIQASEPAFVRSPDCRVDKDKRAATTISLRFLNMRVAVGDGPKVCSLGPFFWGGGFLKADDVYVAASSPDCTNHRRDGA